MSVHNGIPLKRMRAADGKQEFNLEGPNAKYEPPTTPNFKYSKRIFTCRRLKQVPGLLIVRQKVIRVFSLINST